MSDDDVAEQAERLRPWVEWLIATYEIHEWPDCWANHLGMVREIATVRRWQVAAEAQDAGPADGFHWHEGLARFRVRLREAGRRCTGECSGVR